MDHLKTENKPGVVLFIKPCGTTVGVRSRLTDALGLPYVRASAIEPCNSVLRCLFSFIRSRVSDESRIAAFTRRWPCKWRIRFFDGTIIGPFRSRNEAVLVEVGILNNSLEKGTDVCQQLKAKVVSSQQLS